MFSFLLLKQKKTSTTCAWTTIYAGILPFSRNLLTAASKPSLWINLQVFFVYGWVLTHDQGIVLTEEYSAQANCFALRDKQSCNIVDAPDIR